MKDRSILTGASNQIRSLVDPVDAIYLTKRGHNRQFPSVFSFIFSLFLVAPAPSEIRDRDHPTACSVSFADHPTTEITESQDSSLASETQSLAKELCGEVEAPTTPSS